MVPINDTKPPRSALLDVAKAIAIFLVVLGHSRYIRENESSIYAAVYFVHLPVFLICSGAVLFPIRAEPGILNRVWSAVKGYVFAISMFLPISLWRMAPPDLMAGAIWGVGDGLYNQAAWYLLPFSLATALMLWLDKCHVDDVLRLSILAFAVAFSSDISAALQALNPPAVHELRGFFWSIDLLPSFLLGFQVGKMLKANNIISKLEGMSRQRLLFALVIFAVTFFGVVSARGDAFLDLNARRFSGGWWLVFAIATGVTAIFLIAAVLSRSAQLFPIKFLVTIGQSTLLVLLLHAPMQNAVIKAIGVKSVPMSTLVAFLITSLIATLDVLLRRRAPWVRRLYS